jgi:Flp pilus assembly protein TadD
MATRRIALSDRARHEFVMSLHIGRTVRVSIALVLAASPLALMAQQEQPQNQTQPTQLIPVPQPTDELAEHLRTLARNPRDLDALIGAGQSALIVGDATAALSFFGRANDEAPNEGRVKAGLGSALLLLERPDDALRLFGEAAALGIPQSKITVDRGLAYDLRGDQVSAQRDYRLAMRDGQNDELVRRYALSLGISGQKNDALALLDPLLRKQDQAAWRDRTFILAMNGDVRGANSITRSVMPQQADAMEPFLRRLSSFTAAQRARAVTYGAMPEDARTNVAIPTSVIAPTRVAIATPPPTPLPAPRYDAPPPPVAAPPPPVKRKRQPETDVVAETPTDAGVDATAPSEEPPKHVKKAKAKAVLANAQPAVDTQASPQPLAPEPTPAPTYTAPPPPVMVAATKAPPAPSFAPAPPPVVTPPVAPPPPPSSTPPPAPHPQPIIVTAQPRFAIASLLDDVKPEAITPAAHVPTDAELRASRLAAKKKAEAKAKADAEAKALKAEEDAKREAARRNPPREWVQVAGGNNRAGFARTYAKLKAAHAALFEGRAAYYTPLNRTYRILVGPFSDSGDARDYVNQLTKAGLTGFTFSSTAGQEVLKIGSKGKPNGDTAPPTEDTKPTKHRHGKHSSDTADQAPTKHKGDTADSTDAKPKRKHRRR